MGLRRMLALLTLPTWAIIGVVWVLLCFLFCVAWCGLIQMIRKAERNLRRNEETSDGIVEVEFRKPAKEEKPAA